MKNKEMHIKRMNMIIEDMKNDAREFDGKEFNGRTVAEYFGNHGAAIAAIADTLRFILESNIGG